jgi:hypothetical protein
MANCASCGAVLPLNAHFCSSCGAAAVAHPHLQPAASVLTAYPAPAAPAAPMPGYLPSRSTNGMAVAAMVLGIVGVSILAVILGHVALHQIRRTGEDGRGFAIAGLILGYVGVVFSALFIVLVVVAMSAV